MPGGLVLADTSPRPGREAETTTRPAQGCGRVSSGWHSEGSMQGKYRNVVAFAAAWLLRERLRRRIANLVAWTPLTDPEPGCTVSISW